MAATLPTPAAVLQPPQYPIRHRPARARGTPNALATLTFKNVPALAPACAFGLGIAIAGVRWTSPAYLFFALLPLAVLTVFAVLRTPRVAPVVLSALFFVLGGLAAELQPPIDPQSQLGYLATQNTPRTFTGTVVRFDPPKAEIYTAFFGGDTHNETTERLDLRLSSVRNTNGATTPLSGGLRLSIYSGKGSITVPALHCGQQIEVTLAPHPESRYDDPGVWDASAWQHQQGIGALGSTSAATVRPIATHAPPTLSCRLHALQAQASARVLTLPTLPGARHLPTFLTLTPQDASTLTAMLTGDRSALANSTRIGYERTGSFHLLVVSGMHLAIFASVIFFLARTLRLPNVAATLLTIALSTAYAAFTGFGEPVARSLAMVSLYLLARLFFRSRGAIQALALAALLLLAASPRALSGASLQMTLLTVVAIGGIAAPLAERTFAPYLQGLRRLWLIALDPSLPPRVAQLRVHMRLLARHLEPVTGPRIARHVLPGLLGLFLRLLELLLFSLIVELVMALPMALYFHRVTLLGLPVNVLILPLLGLLLPAALATFATLLVVPKLAIVPAAVTAFFLHTVAAIVQCFAALPFGDLRLPGPPPAYIAAWLVLLALSAWIVRSRPRWAPALACALLLLGAGIAIAPRPIRHQPGYLQISAIDVGQGDSILVITPDGHTLLVDGGGLVGQGPDSHFDIGEEVVSPTLWSLGIHHLDAVALTHAHEDHIGGLPAVLANFHPDVLWIGNNPHSAHYAALLAQATLLGIPVQQHFAGDRWTLGSVSIQALWPTRAYQPQATPGNNDSLVLRLAYGDASALLEGDAEAPAERGMLGAGFSRVNLLKVGHHGSSSSSLPEFLSAASPQWSVISCGRRNFYRHPRPVTLSRLESDGVRTYRTDLSGITTFLLDRHSVVSEVSGSLDNTLSIPSLGY